MEEPIVEPRGKIIKITKPAVNVIAPLDSAGLSGIATTQKIESSNPLQTDEVLVMTARQNLDVVSDVRDSIISAFSKLDTPYTDLGETIDLTEISQEQDRLKIEARVQDLLLTNVISSALGRLQERGLYKQASEIDIRKANLVITDEVVDILARSSIPLKESILLLNKVVTTGWTYPELSDEQRSQLGTGNEYRNFGVRTGEYIAPNQQDIPELMQTFVEKLDRLIYNPEIKTMSAQMQEWAVSTIAAWTYNVFLSIHPFADGNGRTARALSEFVQIRMGIEDPIIPSIDKKLSRGDNNPPEYEAQVKAGFVFQEEDKEIYGQKIKDRIKEYVENTPEIVDPLKDNSIANYTGVEESFGIFSGLPRSSRIVRNREDSNPIVISAMNYMKKALTIVQGVA